MQTRSQDVVDNDKRAKALAYEDERRRLLALQQQQAYLQQQQLLQQQQQPTPSGHQRRNSQSSQESQVYYNLEEVEKQPPTPPTKPSEAPVITKSKEMSSSKPATSPTPLNMQAIEAVMEESEIESRSRKAVALYLFGATEPDTIIDKLIEFSTNGVISKEVRNQTIARVFRYGREETIKWLNREPNITPETMSFAPNRSPFPTRAPGGYSRGYRGARGRGGFRGRGQRG